MTLLEIERVAVHSFPDSPRREYLYGLLKNVVQALMDLGIKCDLWFDGSMLTEKAEPQDLDVTVILDPDFNETLDGAQKALITTLGDGAFHEDVDSWAYVRRKREDPYYKDDYLDPAYSWGEQYGLECGDEWLKGFVVIRL